MRRSNALLHCLLAATVLGLTGPAAIAASVSYYQLPSGAYPHDVAPARDGGVWFTGQAQGFLGYFDPAANKLDKIPLGRGAAPHGVIVGPDGAAWVCDGGQNAIVRVDQWVQCSGVLSKVRVMSASTCASVIWRGVPGRGSSVKPSNRSVRKRSRHLQTV